MWPVFRVGFEFGSDGSNLLIKILADARGFARAILQLRSFFKIKVA